MRLFLMIVVLLMVQYKTFGQEILVQEDFEFIWPVQQYNIEGGWQLVYPSGSNSEGGNSRSFVGNAYILFNNLQQYDSVYVEFTLVSYTTEYNPNYLEISTDSIFWENGIEVGVFNGIRSRNITVNTNEYPYIRIHSYSSVFLDNLLVIGYTDTEISNCQYDANQDGMVNAPDLIDFLSWYGTTTVCN